MFQDVLWYRWTGLTESLALLRTYGHGKKTQLHIELTDVAIHKDPTGMGETMIQISDSHLMYVVSAKLSSDCQRNYVLTFLENAFSSHVPIAWHAMHAAYLSLFCSLPAYISYKLIYAKRSATFIGISSIWVE